MGCIDLVMGHLRAICSQTFILFSANDGVHEETPRVSQNVGVGQLGLPYADNCLAQLQGCGLHNVLRVQGSPDIAIVQVGDKSLGKAIYDCRYEIFILPFMLEPALPIAVFTFPLLQDDSLASGNLHRFHT